MYGVAHSFISGISIYINQTIILPKVHQYRLSQGLGEVIKTLTTKHKVERIIKICGGHSVLHCIDKTN